MMISNGIYLGYFHELEEADCGVFEIAGYRVDNRPSSNSYSTLNQPRTNYALTFIQEGSYEYTTASGDKLICRRGDISFLPRGSRYSHMNIAPSRMLVIYFSLKTPDGSSFRPDIDSICRITCRDTVRFERLFGEVIDRYFSLIRSRSEVKAALHSLIGELAREEEATRLTEVELMRLSPAIERLADGGKSLFLTVAELARICCMSEYSFRELFKKFSGITPKAYIDERRIDQVEELLKNSDMTVTDAALACGFNDPSYFFKLYKRLRGHTPRIR